MHCLGKAERSGHVVDAEVVSTGELRSDAENRCEKDDEESVEREDRKRRYRQSGHALKEFLEQQSSVDQEDRHASADTEDNEPDGRHRKQKYQIRVDYGLRKPRQQEYCSADKKHR